MVSIDLFGGLNEFFFISKRENLTILDYNLFNSKIRNALEKQFKALKSEVLISDIVLEQDKKIMFYSYFVLINNLNKEIKALRKKLSSNNPAYEKINKFQTQFEGFYNDLKDLNKIILKNLPLTSEDVFDLEVLKDMLINTLEDSLIPILKQNLVVKN